MTTESFEMRTANSFATLPDAIFCNILEYLDWGDVGRLDTAYLNSKTRNGYLFALQLRKVKVEDNWFWKKAVDRGILDWLIRRNIRVISWDLKVGSDAQLISIASGLPQLQSLDIRDCGNITDAGIIALASGCLQLQFLYITHCDSITDAGIIALASGCPQLRSLNIDGWYNITDAGIIALVNGLRQLQSLNIGFCPNITDDGIRALASGCLKLQSLNIHGCDELTEEGEEIAQRITYVNKPHSLPLGPPRYACSSPISSDGDYE